MLTHCFRDQRYRLTLVSECRCRTDAVDYRKNADARQTFFPASRHLHLSFQRHIARNTIISHRQNCILEVQWVSLSPLTTKAVWTCRVYPYPPPAVMTCRVYPFPSPVWTCRVYPFPPPAVWTCRVYPFSQPAIWAWRVYPFPPPAVPHGGCELLVVMQLWRT